MAAGALMATLCGGCTLLVAAMTVTGATSAAQWSFLLIPALVGGLPAVGGVIIFRQGLKRFRGPKPRQTAAEIFE